MTSPSSRTSEAPASTGGARAPQLRLAPLIVLALMGFILVAMETMPAGLLPEIADGLKAAEGTVGLFVSAYALGTVIVTIPAISLTRRLRRKPLLLVGISLLAGIVGYHGFEHLSWTDSFLNASMILGGMGPVDAVKSEGGKLFAGFYALYSGLAFLVLAGLLFGPVAHRILHNFHYDADQEDGKP